MLAFHNSNWFSTKFEFEFFAGMTPHGDRDGVQFAVRLRYMIVSSDVCNVTRSSGATATLGCEWQSEVAIYDLIRYGRMQNRMQQS